jgi:hypothetical protein
MQPVLTPDKTEDRLSASLASWEFANHRAGNRRPGLFSERLQRRPIGPSGRSLRPIGPFVGGNINGNMEALASTDGK